MTRGALARDQRVQQQFQADFGRQLELSRGSASTGRVLAWICVISINQTLPCLHCLLIHPLFNQQSHVGRWSVYHNASNMVVERCYVHLQIAMGAQAKSHAVPAILVEVDLVFRLRRSTK